MPKFFSLFIMISMLISATAISAFSQAAQPVSEGAKEEAPVPAASPAAPQPKEIAIYGEVQAANAALNTLTVQYYDYDSDSDRTAEIAIGKDSKLVNATALADIKKGDWVDVTYIVADGKNVARMVAVEKEEPAAAAPAE